MAVVTANPGKVREFADADSFAAWLARHHASDTEVWIKTCKVGSGLPSITPKEAIDVVLWWGWIDAIPKSFDDTSFLQRYTPRGRNSVWRQINVDAEPKAKAMLGLLPVQNRYALAFPTHRMRTEAGQKKRITSLVVMLKRGETISPERDKRQRQTKK